MEKILTLHPQPDKQGVSIDRQKYDLIRAAILQVINDRGEISFGDLTKSVEQQVVPEFDGSVPWYVTTVKLDLEARGLIERVPKCTPQQLRLV